MATTKRKRAFLVFKASTQSLRVVTRPPQLDWDEIYWSIDVTIPDPWGRLAGAITLELPEGAPPIVEVKPVEESDGP